MTPTKKAAEAQSNTVLKKESTFKVTMKRLMKNKYAVVGMIIFLIIVLIAIFAPVIAPYSPTEMDYTAILSKPSAKHLFGTDTIGRDTFSRCVYGARYSLSLGLIAALFSASVGIIIGVAVGYAGGHVDNIMMRLCDIWGAIPGNLIVVILSAVIGTGFFQTIFAMSIGGIPGKIRSARAMSLKEREQEYLEASVSINCSKAKIIYRHMLPNIMSPFIVSTTMNIGGSIMSAAGLAYIGLGVQPPTPEWGAMLSAGRSYILTNSELLFFPGLCIAVTVLSINLLGDGLRDALDPRLKD
ncbi:MAG: ABC transporter permease [Oscillospiraceae bacterium]